jgi:uncharacterized protein (TIGR02145 family)
MKKLSFLLSMLASIATSASVTITPISTDFTAQKVTFKVVYANAANNRVWVWIDLCPVSGVTPNTFQPAVISAASAISGSVTYASTNTRGFFVTASPATVTATLSNVVGKFNWCAYGSDYPPNVTAHNGTYTFKGTPPFILTAANGTTMQTVTGKTLPASALTMTPIYLTDRTGYPGVFCIYTGSDLFVDATHFCQQRTTGEKNWEAYVKDSRDNLVYRIVQMPTGIWWMADDLRWDGRSTPSQTTGFVVQGREYPIANCRNIVGRQYSTPEANASTATSSSRRRGICPAGWLIPVTSDITNNISDWAGLKPYEKGNTCGQQTSGIDWWGISFRANGAHSALCNSTYGLTERSGVWVNYVSTSNRTCLGCPSCSEAAWNFYPSWLTYYAYNDIFCGPVRCVRL